MLVGEPVEGFDVELAAFVRRWQSVGGFDAGCFWLLRLAGRVAAKLVTQGAEEEADGGAEQADDAAGR